ncbi:MAG: lantibiotic dehydratase [Leifsonia sp.]
MPSALSSPYTLVRTNPWPFRLLSDSSMPDYDEAFRLLVRLRREWETLRGELESLAGEAIATLPVGEERTSAIRMLRRIRSGRIRPEVQALSAPAAERMLAIGRERQALLSWLAETEPAARNDETAELLRWARDQGVQDATAMTSTVLAKSVLRFAERGTLDKVARRSLPSFVRYHSRSLARVSPFSSYTGVGAVFNGEKPESGSLNVVTTAASSRLMYRLLLRSFQRDPDLRKLVPWRRNELIDRGVESIRIYSREPSGASKIRFEGVSERTIAVQPGHWASVLDSLDSFTEASSPLAEIVQHVAESAGCSSEQAWEVTDRLVRIGALVPVIPVAENSGDFAGEWGSFLESALGGRHPLTELNARTEQTRLRLPTLHGADRVAAMDSAHTAWTATLRSVLGEEQITGGLFHEDAFVSGPLPDVRSHRSTWERDLGSLHPLLRALDNHDVFAAVVDNAFTERFGPTGTCDSLLELSELVALRIETLVQRTPRGAGIRAFESELSDENRKRRERARDALVGWARTATSEYRLTESDLAALQSEKAPGKRTRRATLAVHGQLSGSLLVVNHLYGGPGVYLSRFTAGLAPERVTEFQAYVRSATPDSVASLQLRPVQGFNANLAPDLADYILKTPNEPDSGGRPQRRIQDFRVHRSGAVLHLVEKATNQRFEPRYFGFLVPFVLPSLERMMTAYWGGPAIAFDALEEDLSTRLDSESNDIVRAPRLRYKSLVLSRQRWALWSSQLRAVLADPVTAFADVNLWRENEGIPPAVFLKPLAPVTQTEAGADFRAPKPMLVDFHSHLHVATLAKRLEKFPEKIIVETLDPDPRRDGLASGDDRHAFEVYFEAPYESEDTE